MKCIGSVPSLESLDNLTMGFHITNWRCSCSCRNVVLLVNLLIKSRQY